MSTLRSENLDADGALGATLPPEASVWHRFDVVDRARAAHGVPVTHFVATPAGAESTR